MTHPSLFDPADWIERFKAVGGGFMDTTDSLRFCWVIGDRPLSDNIEARLLYKEEIADPTKVAAVKDFIVRKMDDAIALTEATNVCA